MIFKVTVFILPRKSNIGLEWIHQDWPWTKLLTLFQVNQGSATPGPWVKTGLRVRISKLDFRFPSVSPILFIYYFFSHFSPTEVDILWPVLPTMEGFQALQLITGNGGSFCLEYWWPVVRSHMPTLALTSKMLRTSDVNGLVVAAQPVPVQD